MTAESGPSPGQDAVVGKNQAEEWPPNPQNTTVLQDVAGDRIQGVEPLVYLSQWNKPPRVHIRYPKRTREREGAAHEAVRVDRCAEASGQAPRTAPDLDYRQSLI